MQCIPELQLCYRKPVGVTVFGGGDVAITQGKKSDIEIHPGDIGKTCIHRTIVAGDVILHGNDLIPGFA